MDRLEGRRLTVGKYAVVVLGHELAALAPNVVVKVPVMPEGLAATRTLASKGIDVNMTLCFSVPQAILDEVMARVATLFE